MRKMNKGQLLFGATFGSIGCALGWFFGGMDGLMKALICFTVVDYVSGVTSAAVNKTLSSTIGAKGIAKKVFQFMLVGIAHVLDAFVLKQVEALRDAVALFYIANEGLSILENMGEIGVVYPQWLKRLLKQLRDKDKDKYKEAKKNEKTDDSEATKEV